MKNIEVMFSNNSDEWETPQKVFDDLDAEFNFNLDPCATIENHKCEKYFTQEEDGLAKNWGGAPFSAIRHIARLRSGLLKHFTNQRRTGRSWCF